MISRIPWTKEEVEALDKWQKNPEVHPYTCDCGKVMTATPDGLRCDCGYKQTWCHDYSNNPERYGDK